MQHIFKAGTDERAPTFLLLHGNGGTEKDFIPLVKKLNKNASYLSVRGEVIDKGERRFFKRSKNGWLDEEDVIYRTRKLAQFLDEKAKEYRFSRSNVFAVGYLDGANIAASLLMLEADSLIGAILYHPVVPIRNRAIRDLTGKKVFIGASLNDPLCPREEVSDLERMLKEQNADVHIHWERGRQYITGEEFAASRLWFENHFKK